MSKTATVSKGNSTGRQSERVNHEVFGTRSAVIKKIQKSQPPTPPKVPEHNYKAMQHCSGHLAFPQHKALHQKQE